MLEFEYEEVRDKLEDEGYILTDIEFSRLLEYAKKKAERSGKDKNYVLLLLPDVIKEHFFEMYVSVTNVLRMS